MELNMEDRIISRGEIYMIGEVDTVGSEQHGDRPVLVVQCDEINAFSPTTIIAYITSRLSKKGYMAHVYLPGITGLKKKSMVLTEKVREIDKSRLQDYVGKLDPESMSRVDRGLRYSLGLERSKKKWKTY